MTMSHKHLAKSHGSSTLFLKLVYCFFPVDSSWWIDRAAAADSHTLLSNVTRSLPTSSKGFEEVLRQVFHMPLKSKVRCRSFLVMRMFFTIFIFIYSDELLNNTADFWASHNPTLQHLRVLCQTNYAPPTPLSLLLACSCAWSICIYEERRLLWVFVQCPSLNSVWMVYGGPSMSLIKTGIHLASFWWSRTKNRGPSFAG